MPMARRAALVAIFVFPGLVRFPGGALAQDRATGTVTVPAPPPEPRGVTVQPQAGGPALEVPRGQDIQVQGANVVVIQETPRGTQLTVQNDVLFDFDKSDLRGTAQEALTRVADIIRERHPRAVRIIGHTDAIGSDEYNRSLSLRRAGSVEQWLAANGGGGLPPMQVEGRGKSEPVAPNTGPDGRDDPEGRQKNRRVEVLLER